MSRDDLEQLCLSKLGAVREFPFGDTVMVFKVGGKMFALLPVAGDVKISLKCDPTRAEMLRQTYPAVKPGYYLDKRHWNTIDMDDSMPEDEILDLIEHSYALVVAGLTKKQREALSDAP
jgi:predicted DNA-binding protein (MmcQ/YjbR family)